ncbi:DHH family phosphoesterase [bacterium]|nr:DHH family phosphoesterase [bacterium]
MEIKNIPEAASAILKALRDGKRIILYGDADVDGVTSVIILKETLEDLVSFQNLSSKPLEVFFPDKEKEGYGINKTALEKLKSKAPALLIALDCGIGNVKEVDEAKKMGIEVIIIDHHQLLPEVPKASIIVNPKQKGDPYPFKELSTAGIVYRLIKYIFKTLERSYNPEKFLELAMLSTLADLMPLKDENKKIVEEGISALPYTKRPGLRALIELTEFKGEGIEEVRKKLVSPLNKAGLKDNLHEAFLLLTEKSYERAKEMCKQLLQREKERQEKIKEIYNEIELRIANNDLSSAIIFEGSSFWPIILLGVVASKICQKYQKPTFLFKINEKESVGTVRMPSGKDGVKAMIACREFLKTYGGHPLAAGFRIKNENLENFKNCLIQYFKEK